MTILTTIFAALLRMAGALAGFGAMFLVSDATLQEALATAGLSGTVDLQVARMVSHALSGAAGFLIASQVTALMGRMPTGPAGTRSQAAEAVPRLRRHLEDGRKESPSSVPRYLDPDPAPTKPVAVSFKELGLEHPQASEYPDPAGYRSESSEDYPVREPSERPVSAGSASAEWDDPAPALAKSVPMAPPPPAADAEPEAEELPEAPRALPTSPSLDSACEPEPAAQDAGSSEEATDLWASSVFADDEPGFEPWPDEMAMKPAKLPSIEPVVAVTEPALEPMHVAAVTTSPDPAYAGYEDEPEPDIPASIDFPTIREQAAELQTYAPYIEPEAARPSFALPETGHDPDWYNGAGDEEEDADDDGAGYGSLADIGLGRTHAPRANRGQPGEAGLSPAICEPAGALATVPHGKPQDFRLREALGELMRLDRERS